MKKRSIIVFVIIGTIIFLLICCSLMSFYLFMPRVYFDPSTKNKIVAVGCKDVSNASFIQIDTASDYKMPIGNLPILPDDEGKYFGHTAEDLIPCSVSRATEDTDSAYFYSDNLEMPVQISLSSNTEKVESITMFYDHINSVNKPININDQSYQLYFNLGLRNFQYKHYKQYGNIEYNAKLYSTKKYTTNKGKVFYLTGYIDIENLVGDQVQAVIDKYQVCSDLGCRVNDKDSFSKEINQIDINKVINENQNIIDTFEQVNEIVAK